MFTSTSVSNTPASLKASVIDFVTASLTATQGTIELAALHALLVRERTLIQAPMRIALVGSKNSGKSTLANALMGQTLALMDNRELTYRVNWFRHGERERLAVHCMNGTSYPEAYERLAAYTDRNQVDKTTIEKVRWIEVFHPNPLLSQFDLIDTPGLGSYFVNDSLNTKELLAAEENRPHALVMVFGSKLEQAEVLDELKKFQQSQGGMLNGLTAVAVLTKQDDDFDLTFPKAQGVIADFHHKHPMFASRFFQILPTSAPAALGARTILPIELETLEALARIPSESQFQPLSAIKNSTKFCKHLPDSPDVPAANLREALWQRLGQFGIHFALTALKEGKTLQEALNAAETASNVNQLRQLLLSHFGGRAFLIKSHSALLAIRQKAKQLAESKVSGHEIALGVAQRTEEILTSEMRYREFEVLKDYYQGLLEFRPEMVSRMLRLTGEYGLDVASRLGLSGSSNLATLLEASLQEEFFWRSEAGVSRSDFDRNTRACTSLANSCGAITQRLRQAQAHSATLNQLLSYDY